MRVIGGPNKRLGRLEVFSKGNWEGICGMEFGPREAEVACRQAGLGYAVRGFSTSKYGDGFLKGFYSDDKQISGFFQTIDDEAYSFLIYILSSNTFAGPFSYTLKSLD